MRNYLSKSNFILLSVAIVLSLVFIAVSCNNTVNDIKPRPLGSPGEVLLVIDDDNWNTNLGDTLRNLLSDDFPALPQIETMFKKTRISFSDFQRHFRTYRNILFVSVRPNASSNRVEFRKNEWALNQQVAEVIAKDTKELEELIVQKWPKIKSFFYNGDIDALVKSYNLVYEPAVVNLVKEEYPFSLHFPKGYRLKKKDNYFTWIVNDRIDSHLGVFVFQFSLDSIENTDARSLLELRNKILFEQVPGEHPGSYMTTEEHFPVVVNKSKFAGRKWTELRGLWKVEGDFMGGPFVDYFYADFENNQLIMLEGYVYAPSKPNKAGFVREVEAVLKTFMPV
ncbi:DUF4837 family protein [Carboxylicivirga caseinilyticus]|uniref:DUF4837 family protein n=1 Tax=Carboxylicivirga caseinilyticus TaxID=3417572 RepID=UPI003D354162|nr:DUF4837 family protein [Marinilabiliaceae bacterium A049]